MFISESGKTNNGHSMLDLISIYRGPNRGCGLTVHIYLIFFLIFKIFEAICKVRKTQHQNPLFAQKGYEIFKNGVKEVH